MHDFFERICSFFKALCRVQRQDFAHNIVLSKKLIFTFNNKFVDPNNRLHKKRHLSLGQVILGHAIIGMRSKFLIHKCSLFFSCSKN